MGQEDVSALREVGKAVGVSERAGALRRASAICSTKLPQFKQSAEHATKRLRGARCQQKVLEGDSVDLTKIPIMQCWPEDAAPLINQGLTVTRGPPKSGKTSVFTASG